MARACGCTFCQKHGGVWTSNPEGEVEIWVADADRMQPYRFGTETADFLVCATCGVVPAVTSLIDGVTYAVVNVRCLEDVSLEEALVSPTDFDGEDTGSRLERRAARWSRVVAVHSAPLAKDQV